MISDSAAATGFFEVFWLGEAIGDAGGLDEALASDGVVTTDGYWAAACGEAFLDNDDALETIPVTATMVD